MKQTIFPPEYWLSTPELTIIYKTATRAFRRTTAPEHTSTHSKYAKRGITFDFPSIEAAAEYIRDTLGPRPPSTHGSWGLDRIDNDGNYAPGNIRWASNYTNHKNTRFGQATAKRVAHPDRNIVLRLAKDELLLLSMAVRLCRANGDLNPQADPLIEKTVQGLDAVLLFARKQRSDLLNNPT